HYLEEAPLPVEAVVSGREAARRELRGGDAVLRGATGVQRLGHRSEVHAEAAAHARRDTDRMGRLRPRQLQQLRRRRRRAEGADRAGAVEAADVVARVDRLGDFAFDLESGEEGLEKGTARYTEPFADGERGGEHRHGGMRDRKSGV